MSNTSPLYEYRARLKHRTLRHAVYDGDTYRLEVDLGFGVIKNLGNIRLLGVNTPEVRGPERPDGTIVRDYVRGLFSAHPHDWFIIRTEKDTKGKFGRWLASITLDGRQDAPGPYDLASHLVSRGYAKVVEY